MVWQSGQSLYGDRFTIDRQIGKGGLGITYLAHNQRGQRWVIKTLKDEVMTNPEYAEYRDKYLRDFKDEALRLAICRHPHIVQIENVFHHEGLPCIVMEYIQGMDLGKRVKRYGPLSESEALRYIRQVGEALRVVHEKGLLHRDLKPQNIMLRAEQDEAVLIDFGIAREFIPGVTQTHTFALTPAFAPIEQYDEQAQRGEYTDVYALAATLATLVTGSSPPPSYMRVVNDRFKVPQCVSRPVQEAIQQGMAVQPKDRVRSVSEWLKMLELDPEIAAISPFYQPLAKLLAAEKWREADEETAKIMLQIAGKEEGGWLDDEDIENFPGEELQAIDRLWLKYSNGRFGFSQQKCIYQSLGGTQEYDQEIWEALGDRVGWRKAGNWLDFDELTFNLQASEAHLPFLWIWLVYVRLDLAYLLTHPYL
ncbi:serine/threonine-protein kinase [Oscillatoria acuminata]|uniref:Serine/threonine protein kinase n=1 Tax=Oscillatoria acuminata PCC 6304 TaxID=56110 RepID=K9TLW5_9CYAN|nr:serine/threonine-protein kinase [Oscillatoria acuminata]AFY83156.1 serine/threonine protein kinase [Oscillatoria acuminata PCC 6304]